jgi:MFS family permease
MSSGPLTFWQTLNNYPEVVHASAMTSCWQVACAVGDVVASAAAQNVMGQDEYNQLSVYCSIGQTSLTCLMGPVIGALSDRIGRKKVLVCAIAMVSLPFVVTAWWDWGSAKTLQAYKIFSSICLGLTGFGGSAVMNAMFMESVPRCHQLYVAASMNILPIVFQICFFFASLAVFGTSQNFIWSAFGFAIVSIALAMLLKEKEADDTFVRRPTHSSDTVVSAGNNWKESCSRFFKENSALIWLCVVTAFVTFGESLNGSDILFGYLYLEFQNTTPSGRAALRIVMTLLGAITSLPLYMFMPALLHRKKGIFKGMSLPHLVYVAICFVAFASLTPAFAALAYDVRSRDHVYWFIDSQAHWYWWIVALVISLSSGGIACSSLLIVPLVDRVVAAPERAGAGQKLGFAMSLVSSVGFFSRLFGSLAELHCYDFFVQQGNAWMTYVVFALIVTAAMLPTYFLAQKMRSRETSQLSRPSEPGISSLSEAPIINSDSESFQPGLPDGLQDDGHGVHDLPCQNQRTIGQFVLQAPKPALKILKKAKRAAKRLGRVISGLPDRTNQWAEVPLLA